mmetsp:Transcript_30123/g.72792  ORF Transcript_30123/g.72792 Transcript_30123/m.72792 type:complete len:200 (-) Transcript_30123:3171-3770(-)
MYDGEFTTPDDTLAFNDSSHTPSASVTADSRVLADCIESDSLACGDSSTSNAMVHAQSANPIESDDSLPCGSVVSAPVEWICCRSSTAESKNASSALSIELEWEELMTASCSKMLEHEASSNTPLNSDIPLAIFGICFLDTNKRNVSSSSRRVLDASSSSRFSPVCSDMSQLSIVAKLPFFGVHFFDLSMDRIDRDLLL